MGGFLKGNWDAGGFGIALASVAGVLLWIEAAIARRLLPPPDAATALAPDRPVGVLPDERAAGREPLKRERGNVDGGRRAVEDELGHARGRPPARS